MAMLIGGRTTCFICKQPITDPNGAGGFPPFVENELDPLFIFNDSVFHHHCLERHPLGRQALSRFREFEAANPPGDRVCTVCGQLITDPDEFFSLGRLVGDAAHPLHRHNYARIHKSCLVRWEPLDEVLRFLQTERDSGKSRGRAIDYVIKVLQKAQKAAM